MNIEESLDFTEVPPQEYFKSGTTIRIWHDIHIHVADALASPVVHKTFLNTVWNANDNDNGDNH
jgi:hypothetical protein